MEKIVKPKTNGIQFLRQRPIENYIVDFFDPNEQLIIEIDGSSHSNKAREDKQRELRLEELGFTVLLFSEGLVLNDLSQAVLVTSHTIHCQQLKGK